MADDRGGAWSSSISRLNVDPRQRVGVSCSGRNMYHGTGTIRHLMAPPNKRKRGHSTESRVRGIEPAREQAGRILLKVTNVATSSINGLFQTF